MWVRKCRCLGSTTHEGRAMAVACQRWGSRIQYDRVDQVPTCQRWDSRTPVGRGCFSYCNYRGSRSQQGKELQPSYLYLGNRCQNRKKSSTARLGRKIPLCRLGVLTCRCIRSRCQQGTQHNMRCLHGVGVQMYTSYVWNNNVLFRILILMTLTYFRLGNSSLEGSLCRCCQYSTDPQHR